MDNASEEEGPEPRSSFIGKALHGHPVMRFLAVSAAAMVGMSVASKVAKGAGTKFLGTLERQTVPLIDKEWQTSLLHDFRSLQSTLDTWEGAVRTTDPRTGREVVEKTRAGFWASQAEKERAAAALRGGIEAGSETPAEWAWRDEMQQTLVRQARRLPYELPAMYATQRLITDRAVGGQKKQVNWHSPTDIISDFATQSVKNLASVLTPWELGQAGLKHGWRKLMTYGDFVSDLTPFQQRLRGYSLGVRGSLSLLGHDASSILFQGVQKSQRLTGAFSTAINEYIGANRSWETRMGIKGEVPVSPKGGVQGFGINFWNTSDAYVRAMQDHIHTGISGVRQEGVSWARNNFNAGKTFSNFFPKFDAFGRGFKRRWNYLSEFEANQAAVRSGQGTYEWRGVTKNANRVLAAEKIHGQQTELEQIAAGIEHYAGGGPGQGGFRGSQFYRERQKVQYKRFLLAELRHQGINEEAAASFVNGVTVLRTPFDTPAKTVTNRLRFGERSRPFSADGSNSPWHQDLEKMLGAHPAIGENAHAITANISRAVRNVDQQFIRMGTKIPGKESSELEAQIRREWNTVYQQQILPWARERVGHIKLPYETFDNMTDDMGELLTRKSAQVAGIPLFDERGHPRSGRYLREQLNRLGFHTKGPADLRNYLVERGHIDKPWTQGGFNVLGLRPLSAAEGLERGYFGSSPQLEGAVKGLLGDITGSEPFVGSMLSRPVGRGVYVTASGKIIDLMPLRSGLRKMTNLFQEHFQIPFLHIPPLNLVGYGAARQMGEGFPIKFAGDEGAQPFFDSAANKSYAWLKTRQGLFAPRGKTIEYGPEGSRVVLENSRPFGTDRYRMLGRMARLAIGDKGQIAPEAMGGRFAKLKQRMAWDPDQRQSLFRYIQRIRSSRAGDLQNPANYAKWLMSGEIPEHLTDEQLLGYSKFESYLRRFGFTGPVARQLEESGYGKLRGRESAAFASGPGELGPLVSLGDVHSPSEMTRVVRTTLNEHLHDLQEELRERPGDFYRQEQLRKVRSAQHILRSRYLASATETDFFNKQAAQAMRSTGIHTRLDEMRADMYRYLSAHDEIMRGPGRGMRAVDDLLERLDQLKAQRLITGGQYTEAKAAALSMQLNYLNLHSYETAIDTPDQIRKVLMGLLHRDKEGKLVPRPSSAGALKDIASYETRLTHRGPGPRRLFSQQWLQHFGSAEYDFPGYQYNPFGGNQTYQFVPTFGEQFSRHPWRALKNVSGLTSYSDPKSFSGSSIPMMHFYDRLNRYFATFGQGVRGSAFKGPQGFFYKGLLGRRVLPAMVGATTAMALDRTLGGFTTSRDQQGNRVYRPGLTGIAATGIAHARIAAAHVIPGGKSPDEVREEYFGNRDVPIRKGRYWPLGGQKFSGGRIQHFRPNWYRTFMSGYQYGDQGWKTPTERLLYGYDYSPLRPFDPYRFEKNTYSSRPYPVTGDYFTGPWGSATSLLNATIGKVAKPNILMHRRELAQEMSTWQEYGQYAMGPPQPRQGTPLVAARNPTGSVGMFQPRPAPEVLGLVPSSPASAGVDQFSSAYQQPYGFLGVPYGTNPDRPINTYRQSPPATVTTLNYSAQPEVTGVNRINRYYMRRAMEAPAPVYAPGSSNFQSNKALAVGAGRVVSIGHAGVGELPSPKSDMGEAHVTAAGLSQGAIQTSGYGTPRRRGGAPSNQVAGSALSQVNQYYTNRAKMPPRSYNPYNRVTMAKTQGFDPRVMARANPITQGSLKYQASQFGYESQELFGIYGFLFGSARQALGLGGYDFTPQRPVLQSASRAYGAERSFWDWNIGGFGDFPNLSEGEYGNLELSEIIRRFIPHRRRDINEINPIPNQLGRDYPWLPGNEYFQNFKTGDPYSQIPFGEIRLPGRGYELTHKLHPDKTGRYGLLDQHKILGETAPWSPQYRALNEVVDKAPMSEEDRRFIRITRKHVAAMNKRQSFSPYKYAHTNFQTEQAKVIGFEPGHADILHTTFGVVRLAGVRARSGTEAQDFVKSLIQPGDEVHLTYDANRPPPNRQAPIDAIIKNRHGNINRMLLDNSDFGRRAKTSAPIDQRVRENKAKIALKAQVEMLQHRNILLFNKFLGKTTPVENWERYNVYGSTFPQWSHPYRDFLHPMAYRAKNRNPFLAAVIMGAAGGLFTQGEPAKTIARLTGATVGFGIATFSDAKTFQTGRRFIPANRKKEAAIDENVDILNYVKYKRLYNYEREQAIKKEHTDPETIARKIENSDYKKFQYSNLGPNTSSALAFRRNLQQTLYGANMYGDVMNLAAAIPKRKRDHFLEFIDAPIDERQRILSTAPRLERRIYEARWGMKVERRPDLNQYFSEHELPSPDWSGWNPNVNLEQVKLKIMHHQGLDASQSGYYPQQVQEANLTNPSYPNFSKQSSISDVQARLKKLLADQGINGNVIAIPSAYPGTRVQLGAQVS